MLNQDLIKRHISIYIPAVAMLPVGRYLGTFDVNWVLEAWSPANNSDLITNENC